MTTRAESRRHDNDFVAFVLNLLWLMPGALCLFAVTFWLGLVLMIMGVLFVVNTRSRHDQVRREWEQAGFGAELAADIEDGYG